MANNDFLPEGYKIPKSPSNYLTLEEGANQMRILSSAITGFVWFEDDPNDPKKRIPKRVKNVKEVPAKYLNAKDNRDRAKHFWAFVVYNYAAESIQILELKQTTIQTAIEDLALNPKWGSPKEYDIVITKKKTGSKDYDVEYSVLPDPKSPLDKGVAKAYQDMNLDLNLLMKGKDPFNPGDEVDPDDIPDDLGQH